MHGEQEDILMALTTDEQYQATQNRVLVSQLADQLTAVRVDYEVPPPKTRQQWELQCFLDSASCVKCRMPHWNMFQRHHIDKQTLMKISNRERQKIFSRLCMGLHEKMCLTSYLNCLTMKSKFKASLKKRGCRSESKPHSPMRKIA
eukprot:TRINITY_DN4097_c0_g1_i1.p1 TRINITY_DN4097_c0_g1~~TRINITY_DN4097_c0_g1_i1.p1  ORF type:complete len:146 (+),score=20.62 TRINITY_DN4097_c0_g1_i1:51-488(+)